MCVCVVVGGIGANISAMLRNRALSYLHRSVLLRILVEDDNSLLYETQVGHDPRGCALGDPSIFAAMLQCAPSQHNACHV